MPEPCGTLYGRETWVRNEIVLKVWKNGSVYSKWSKRNRERYGAEEDENTLRDAPMWVFVIYYIWKLG